MATRNPKRNSGLKRAPARRTPRKAKPGTRGLSAAECRLDSLPAEAEEVRARVEREGGLVLGAYSDPLGKNALLDRKSTRLNSSHGYISYAVFCLKKKKTNKYLACIERAKS